MINMINMSNVKPKIRLSQIDIDIIRATACRVVGDDARVRIFGSRAREDEKGGDIDLLVETGLALPNRVASACRLASELQMELGDQRIDVIIVDAATEEMPIHQVARETGVIL